MNTLFQTELIRLGVLYIFAAVLTVVIIGASYLLSLSTPDSEKVSAYECGFDPYEDARNVFDVRFYIVAILFLIFDIEALFVVPFAANLGLLNSDAYWYMLDFIVELVIGYIYVWKIGALNWK